MRATRNPATVWKGVVATCAVAMSGGGVSAQQTEEWIVMGADLAGRSQEELQSRFAGLAQAPEFEVVETRNGLTIARIDRQASALVQSVGHLDFHRCGGYTVHPTRESALRELNNPIYQPGFVQSEGVLTTTIIDQQATVSAALDKIDPAGIVNTIQELQDIGTRYYEASGGEQSADLIAQLWAGYIADYPGASVEQVEHDWAQNSVIATIPGSLFPDEIVVIGGHLDLINLADTNAAPGADDDASGIAAVSETLRVLMETDFKPERTIQVMAYAAEEVGLRGSGGIAGEYAGSGKNVVAALQLDMTGFRGSEKDMYFVTDFVNPHVTDFLKALIQQYNTVGPHAITFGETECGYACSDHASWTRNGYPSAFPFEARFEDFNPMIHSPQDLVQNLDTSGAHQARFAKLAAEFAIELGDADSPTATK